MLFCLSFSLCCFVNLSIFLVDMSILFLSLLLKFSSFFFSVYLPFSSLIIGYQTYHKVSRNQKQTTVIVSSCIDILIVWYINPGIDINNHFMHLTREFLRGPNDYQFYPQPLFMKGLNGLVPNRIFDNFRYSFLEITASFVSFGQVNYHLRCNTIYETIQLVKLD